MPAVAASLTACTAYARALSPPSDVPAHDGSPSVASKMNFGFGSVRVSRYATAALTASPVGVPFPSGVSALTCAVTAAALSGPTVTGTASVTDSSMHSSPSPSGKAFRPQDIDELVALTTSLTAGTTEL